MTVAALEDNLCRALVQALALPAFAGPDFAPYPQRAAATADIHAAIAAVLANETCQHALDRLAAAEVPVADVVSLDAVAKQPALVDVCLFVETAAGPLLRFPVAMAGVLAATASQPPP